jgi:hypothetical protein
VGSFKAANLLEAMGVKLPDEKDVVVFDDVLDRHFDLKPADGSMDVIHPQIPN